jgi:hypothetical protein
MKVTSYVYKGNVTFDSFVVVKCSDSHYGVYQKGAVGKIGDEVTHGVTLHDACKKAKLLQIGYQIARSNFYL